MNFFTYIDANEEEVRDIFLDCGAIENVRIVRDKELGSGKGFGYVNFQVIVFFVVKLLILLFFNFLLFFFVLHFTPNFFSIFCFVLFPWLVSPSLFYFLFFNISISLSFKFYSSCFYHPLTNFALLRSMLPII